MLSEKKWDKNIECFIGCDKEYDEADIVLFGAGFDGTTSFRPGARFAPKAIRGESYGLETYSPYQDRDLTAVNVFDFGDLDLPFGNTKRVLAMIEECTDKILQDGKIPVMMGGEHLVTLGAFRSVVKKYPGCFVIHLDAHTDLREDYLGERLSHATVMRRVWELAGDKKIFQFGIRSGEKDEFEFAKAHTVLQKFDLNGFENALGEMQNAPVYFSLDLDVLDPSVFPGTGTPEAGGVSFQALLDVILQLKNLNIIGCDINELSPPYDASGASTMTACKALREILLAIAVNR